MATTVNSDMIVYNDLAQTAYLERIQDVMDIFNGSSNGAIILDNELIEGDLRKRAFYKLGGSIAHRDVNSVATIAGQKIGSGEMVGVKVPFKYGPYETTEEAFKRRARSPFGFPRKKLICNFSKLRSACSAASAASAETAASAEGA